jgi:O-acetyl-ADP-ribose deacetylase (regulator of RNase III)
MPFSEISNCTYFQAAAKIDPEIVCIPTCRELNSRGELIMGAGLALEFKNKFPMLPSIFGEALRANPNAGVILTKFPEAVVSIAAVPSKNKWREPADIQLINESLNCLVDYVNIHGVSTVLLPRLGCGLGGLNWFSCVRTLYDELLDTRFYVHNNDNMQMNSAKRNTTSLGFVISNEK